MEDIANNRIMHALNRKSCIFWRKCTRNQLVSWLETERVKIDKGKQESKFKITLVRNEVNEVKNMQSKWVEVKLI